MPNETRTSRETTSSCETPASLSPSTSTRGSRSPPWTSAVDGNDLILRLGDFPAAAEAAEVQLSTWGELASYDVSDIDASQALNILFLSVVTVALRNEHYGSGGIGPTPVRQGQLLREGAPERSAQFCVRIDGEFVMAMLADQFDKSVVTGGAVRAAVKRRRRAGSRRAKG